MSKLVSHNVLKIVERITVRKVTITQSSIIAIKDNSDIKQLNSPQKNELDDKKPVESYREMMTGFDNEFWYK